VKDNLTDIICILDRSGSMGSIRSDAIGGFNTFLAANQDAIASAREISIAAKDAIAFMSTPDGVYNANMRMSEEISRRRRS